MAGSDVLTKNVTNAVEVRSAIHEERGDVAEKRPEYGCCIVFKLTFIDGVVHQLHPAITSLLVNCKRGVSHAQCRMTPQLQVILRSTEAKRQEQSQAFFCASEIVGRVHWPQDTVGWYLPIKSGDESLNTINANYCTKLVLREGSPHDWI